MYLYKKPHAPRPMGSGDAKADSTGTASTEQASTSHTPGEADCPPSSGPRSFSSSSKPPSPTTGPPPDSSTKTRRTFLPISFPSVFFQRSNAPSASVAPSTAEGKPVPLADATAAHRTSALQKLNSTYPSVVRRHQYAESTGAQSSTYSQPVLVRTYSGPSPSQGSRTTRQSSRPRGSSRRVPLPPSSTTGAVGFSRQPIQPALSDIGVSTSSNTNQNTNEDNGINAYRVSMPRSLKSKKGSSSGTSSKLPLPLPLPLPWPWQSASSRPDSDEAKLPPVEAFTFKSFMADMQARGGDNDIGADLDRIAEICARSRYSLSNQYEVHVAPHGSGASFVSGVASSTVPIHRGKKGRSHVQSQGPTLQAIRSDDENSTRSHPRRRNGARRRSVAYGTLETIMSSSRSSEEDKSKKKSAAELAGEVRGRAARKAWDQQPAGSGSGSGSGPGSVSAAVSTGNGSGSQDADMREPASSTTTAAASSSSNNNKNRLARKKSASFASAIMDSGRNGSSSTSQSHTKNPPSALLSEPAMPQTSNSSFGVRTAPAVASPEDGGEPNADSVRGSNNDPSGSSSPPRAAAAACHGRHAPHLTTPSLRHQQHHRNLPGSSSSSSWTAWMPWRGAGQTPQALEGAEGSLRQLLRHQEMQQGGLSVGDGQG
ncbi:hypothetical protein N656DRAFT_770057 [Canariomyces notabilis]|uniref:Uncharacterized protein n=1 Tax=Canariomyces notabilis TaxID=2074819 RepID=A0AAN6TAS5_9PEZI|nr:hypothetical protein N656DRAFT_770057 [Canariomyces arenarius]